MNMIRRMKKREVCRFVDHSGDRHYDGGMQKTIQIRLRPEQAANRQAVMRAIEHETGINRDDITTLRIKQESVDARRKQIYIQRTYEVYVGESPAAGAYQRTSYQDCSDLPQVVIVGAGPAGLFAALRLLENGYKPVILERGKSVEQRAKDIAAMMRSGVVNPDSNYCYGEGGAGAFSDGKLYTRSDKRGDVGKVLGQFCQHGADPSILYQAHPHIGSDKLPGVIRHIRNTIQTHGGEIHYQSTVSSLLLDKDGKVQGVVTDTGKSFEGPVILATGHSAGDLFRELEGQGVTIQSKGIAVGVRLEHPQGLIDQIQYHDSEGRGRYLPPAEYTFVTQVRKRGVYSFCMCPGGVIVPTATKEGLLSINGMSASSRSGRWANSGMVVELHPEDLPEKLFGGNLGMLKFVEALEKRTWKAGGGYLKAPAQRMTDFVEGHLSESLPASSYFSGLTSTEMSTLLPHFISDRLREAFTEFGSKAKGFLTEEALVLGSETRTSSPVRIPRDPETLQQPGHEGLFPAGEGAGYAGGIVSSAMDGIAVADAVARYLSK